MSFRDYEGNSFRPSIVRPGQGIELGQHQALAMDLRLLRNCQDASLPGHWRHPGLPEMIHESGFVFWVCRRFHEPNVPEVVVDHRAYRHAGSPYFWSHGFLCRHLLVSAWFTAIPDGADWRDYLPGGDHDHLVFPNVADDFDDGNLYTGNGAANAAGGADDHVLYLHPAGDERTIRLWAMREGDSAGNLMAMLAPVAWNLVAVMRIVTSPAVPVRPRL